MRTWGTDLGIEARPLINRLLEPLENRVEILMSECRLAHSYLNNPDDGEEVQLMTLLVSFDPHSTQRWTARSLAATFITAHSTFSQLPADRDLAEWLGSWLDDREPASLNIVFLLPEHTANLAEQISELLTRIREMQHHHIQLAVAVSSRPVDWNSCAGIDGFVLATEQKKQRVALQVFNMLSALMSPGMAVCVDEEDLRQVFGPADKPSRMVSGVWLSDDAVFTASEEDQQTLKESTAVAFLPSTFLQLSSLNKLLKFIRKSVPECAEIIMMNPYGMASKSMLGEQVVPTYFLVSSTENVVTDEPTNKTTLAKAS